MPKELSNGGWVKLHRKVLDWEWYDDVNVRILFFHLLLKVNFEDRNWQGRTIKRGQFVTSLSHLAKQAGLSVMQVRSALNKLKSTHEITHEGTPNYSVITIINYDTYQEVNTRSNKRVTNDQQTSNKRLTTREELKNEKNVKNDKKREDTPTPLKEIKYLKREEITNSVMEEIAQKYEVPLGFVSDCWDTAQNWLDAKGKLQKDYKAFLSNWVKRERADMLLKVRSGRGRGGVVDART